MIIRLYLDEDSMDGDLVEALRSRGVDVITVTDAGMIERGDEDQLNYATAQGRVLYSFNVAHYYRLHTSFLAQGQMHAGIILADQRRYSAGEQMRRLLKFRAARTAEEMRNQLVFLSAWG